jgi:type IV pilus assembly protein PilV
MSSKMLSGLTRKAQQGVSLIEVLIAILILSVGLLGIAALQAATLRYQQGAWARAGAAVISTDLSERVRANPAIKAVSANVLGNYSLQTSFAAQQAATLTPASCASGCTPSQLAAADLTALQIAARQQLPQGAIIATPSPVGAARFTNLNFTVLWFDKDFVDTTGTAIASPVCGAATTGPAARLCCPAVAAAPAGTRCVTSEMVP